MRKGLEEEQTNSREKLKTMLYKHSRRSMKASSRVSSSPTFQQNPQTKKQRAVHRTQDPSSTAIIVFDLLSLLALFHDLLVTPYSLAWDMEFDGALLWMTLISAVYWTVGILVKFRTGFFLHGELHLDPREVAMHYIQTVFVFDLALVVVDWAIIIGGLSAADTSTSVNYRISKVFRIMKVLRLARVMELLERMVASLLPSNRLVLRLLQVILGTLIFTHLMCCAWYALGQRNSSDTDKFWIDGLFALGHVNDVADQPGAEPLFAGSSDAFRYLTSFHWTLAQITLGAISIEPSNSVERLFCIFLLMTGVLFNAVIVSLISSQTMEYVAMRQEQLEMASTLRRFLEQSHVDVALQVRVRRQIRQRLAKSRMLLSESDVPALNMLSSALRAELLFEVRLPNMLTHPLFRMWTQIDQYALRAVCDDAVRVVSSKPQDYLFIAGQSASHAYHLIHGELRYSQDSETSFEQAETVTSVERGTWIAEMALWSHWLHVGKIEADTPCLMLTVSATDLLLTLPRHPLVGYLTKYYGRAYFVRISVARPPHSKWPNDLKVPHTEASDLLSPDVGLELLEREHRLGNVHMSASEMAKLCEEIKSERCAIQMGHGGALERIVALSNVKVIREEDGKILVEMARADKGDECVLPVCALPGLKRSRGEYPSVAMERLMKEVLAPFAPALRLTTSEEDIDVKNSSTMHILTKYLKTVHYALLRADIPVPSLARAVAKHPLHIHSDHSDFLEEFADCEIFAVQHGDRVRFLTWLSPETWAWMKGMVEESEALLSDWIRSFSCESPTRTEDYAKFSLPSSHHMSNTLGSDAGSTHSTINQESRRSAIARNVSLEKDYEARGQPATNLRKSGRRSLTPQRMSVTFRDAEDSDGVVDVLTVPPEEAFAIRV